MWCKFKNVRLDYFFGISVAKLKTFRIGRPFNLFRERNEEGPLQVLPKLRKEAENNPCAQYLTPKFEYVTRAGLGKYFAIWGCQQINNSTYDRGLWVLGESQNEMNMTFENAREVINEAIIDMKLEDHRGIWKNIIINENKFTPQEMLNCSVDRFHIQCYIKTGKI